MSYEDRLSPFGCTALVVSRTSAVIILSLSLITNAALDIQIPALQNVFLSKQTNVTEC